MPKVSRGGAAAMLAASAAFPWQSVQPEPISVVI